MKRPKIVLWDIETSGIIATTWNLYPDSIHHSNMLQDWFIVCAAWKELGDKEVQAVSILGDSERFNKNHRDDYYVIKTLRDMLEDVDILIHHNGDKFDLKMFNTRLMYHGLPPLPNIVTIDTLKEIKKVARLTSNRLDFIGPFFGGQGKMDTPPGTWLKSMQGDAEAIKTMVEYNKVDVNVLEFVYNKMRPYMTRHPHMGMLEGGEKKDCPKCGYIGVVKHKLRVSAGGAKTQQYQCPSCGGYHTAPVKKEKENEAVN